MSKPILSELEYNADDVASAILEQSDLAITNEELGFSDVSSYITKNGSWTDWHDRKALKFQKIIFIYLNGYYSSVPANDTIIFTIDDADLRPEETVVIPGAYSYEGDNATLYKVKTNGDITVENPISAGDDTWRFIINATYHLF